MSKSFFFCVLALGLLAIGLVHAQAPAQVIIQAETPAPANAVTRAPASSASATDSITMVQLLQDMQATNAETIKKQEAALEALDELQRAADQLKIFSKRG